MSGNASALLSRLLARGKFRHVEVLLKLAELGSVQRAADAIGLTQSSVTQTLAYLESLLETPLFQRHARGVRPTAACDELLPVARQLMGGLVDVASSVAAQRQQGGSTVRLLASAAATSGLLLGALPRFHEAHPAIEVRLREAEGDDQLLAIARGEVDLVVCRRPAVMPQGWLFEPLLPDRCVVVCDPAHPLARRKGLAFDTLRTQVWLGAPPGQATRATLDRMTAHWPGGPRLHPLVTRLLQPLQAMLAGSERVALLPLSFVQPHLHAGTLAALPVREAMPLEPIGVLAPAEGARRGAAALGAFLRDHGLMLPTS